MRKNNDFKIHRDSEIWRYEGQIEFTQELVDFYEQERKKIQNESKNDSRNTSLENIYLDSTYKLLVKKPKSVDEQVLSNILMQQIFDAMKTLTEVEKRRFILNRIGGLKIVEIAELEKVSSVTAKLSIDSAERKLKIKLEQFR